MKKSELPLTQTLRVIERYKAGLGGNIFCLFEAAKNDALENIGRNPAFIFINDRKDGNEWTPEEKAIFLKSYNKSVHDATVAIIDRVYSAMPHGMVTCRLFREYCYKG